MNTTNELSFLFHYLKNYNIPICFYDKSLSLFHLDNKIRQILGYNMDSIYADNFITHQLKPNTIYKITDQFSCVYFMLQFPSEDQTKPLIIGPYLHSAFDEDTLMQYIEPYSISPQDFQALEEIFSKIPVLLDDTFLCILLQTFGEIIWGGIHNFQFQHLDHHLRESTFSLLPPRKTHEIASGFDTQMYESYLLHENNLIQAISKGDLQVAEETLSVIASFPLGQFTAEQLRNMKNYAIAINSICRKTAERNTSNSYQVMKLATRFTNKIELCASPENCASLLREIVRKYCLLIKNHSMREYSPLIQQAIKQVDLDLTADLSLNAMAKHLNTNASYLSTQFKKITGISYTEYVQKRRIERAVLLLNTTSLQIQTIAQYCGITDLNYFSKLFKKYVHSTPSTYRKNLSKLEK